MERLSALVGRCEQFVVSPDRRAQRYGLTVLAEPVIGDRSLRLRVRIAGPGPDHAVGDLALVAVGRAYMLILVAGTRSLSTDEFTLITYRAVNRLSAVASR